MIITIDGPSASGKSSLARKLANELGIYYLNSGLLYRALAFILINKFNYSDAKLKNINIVDIDLILSELKYYFNVSVEAQGAKSDGKTESIKYQEVDITPFLKTPHIDQIASILSENKLLRLSLLDYQRNFSKENDLVTDGRDCGSVVFPDADVKIFLTASIQVRALRWQKEMKLKGLQYSLQECEQLISERDKRDQEREIAPLIIPKDAIVLDNSDLNQEETFNKALEIIQHSTQNK